MNKPTPKIKITGVCGSGTSSLAYAIKEALKSHGIHVAVTGDEDEMEVMGESWKARLSCLKGEVVIVETKREGFSA